jgi:glycosyltransferase involved in cell wall biosynthesis
MVAATRVAIVTPVLSHFEVPMFRLAANEPEFDVHVFHSDPSDNVRYDHEHQTVIDWGEDLRAGYPGTYFVSVRALKAALWAWRPHVILQYGYSWKGALSLLAGARLRRIPVVHRGLLNPRVNERGNPLISQAWRLVRARLLRCFQAHHYGGSYSEQVLRDARIPEERRYFVPFSVDTPFFAHETERREVTEEAQLLRASIGWGDAEPVLLFICQHSLFKGPDLMIEIAQAVQRTIPEAKLLMAGSGALTAALKRAAAEKLAPGSFHFPGFVASKSTVPFYLASSIVVFPSRYDTWSRAVNEAMIARRPCLVSDRVPAAGGLVEDGQNGYVLTGLDPNDYAERIRQFLALPPERRREMGEAARTRALEFSYEAHIGDLRRSFLEVT